MKYEATLLGVRVGENLRPVEPSLQIFILMDKSLRDAKVERGA